MKFALIDAEKTNFPVAFMCRELEVSKSGYYAWRERGPSQHAQDDEELAAAIVGFHAASRQTYGSPRIHEDLKDAGHKVSRKRVVRLMQEQEIAARRKKPFRRTTDSNHPFPIAENVVDRDFLVDEPNRIWVTDITYIWTREGWLYLAAIVDLYSRTVVGWAMSETIDRNLCLNALTMAVVARRPGPGLVHHSDRGSQYASADYRRPRRRADEADRPARRRPHPPRAGAGGLPRLGVVGAADGDDDGGGRVGVGAGARAVRLRCAAGG